MDTDSGPDEARERESNHAAARHAYLVAAYDNYYVLERLLRLLDHERHDIYLHVDEKARGFEPHRFFELCRRSRLVIMPRISVYWGDYTQVESILRMMRRALAEDSYAYLHLLSDSDLPLRSSSELLAFFAQHQGQEFVEFGELTESKRTWVAYWYPFNRHVRSPRPFVRALYARGRRLSLALQRLTGVDRTEGLQGDLRSGSDWYSITAALATHVVSQEPEIRRMFRSTFIPTEFVIHTLTWNSGFRARTCDASRPHGDNLRLVDFRTRGSTGEPSGVDERTPPRADVVRSPVRPQVQPGGGLGSDRPPRGARRTSRTRLRSRGRPINMANGSRSCIRLCRTGIPHEAGIRAW